MYLVLCFLTFLDFCKVSLSVYKSKYTVYKYNILLSSVDWHIVSLQTASFQQQNLLNQMFCFQVVNLKMDCNIKYVRHVCLYFFFLFVVGWSCWKGKNNSMTTSCSLLDIPGSVEGHLSTLATMRKCASGTLVSFGSAGDIFRKPWRFAAANYWSLRLCLCFILLSVKMSKENSQKIIFL